MNRLKGIIASVETAGDISLVEVRVQEVLFSSLVIDTPDTATYLQEGQELYVVFKETEVAIGKGLSGELSLRNRFPATITQMEKGQLLTKLWLDLAGIRICSIITTRSAQRMGLQIGESVEGLIKTNEVSLLQG